MPTKTTTKATRPATFGDTLREREAAALRLYAERRDQHDSEREQTPALHDAVSDAEDAVEDTEARARAGEPVTGADLVATRGDADVARLRLAGSEARQRQFAKWLSKAHTRSDVARIVRGVLVARLLPGVESHATFSSADLKGLTPDTLPTLVVQQISGAVNDEGIGSGQVKITLHRSSLHAPLDSERLRQALEAAGIQIDGSGFNFGVNVLSTAAGVDEATVTLRNVADDTPLIAQPAQDAEGMDEELALTITAAHDRLDAVGHGARIVSTTESDGLRHTVVRLYVATAVDVDKPDARRLGSGALIFASIIAQHVGKVTPGLGRCLEAREVDVPVKPAERTGGEPSGSLALDFQKWKRSLDAGGVYGVELTYVSRTG